MSERNMRDLAPGQRPANVYGQHLDEESASAMSEGSADNTEPAIPSAPKLLKLFVSSTRTKQDVEPEDYLGAIAELLFLTICCSFCITYIVNRPMLDDNPIKNMVGYNNPCAFWDFPPALYFAAAMFCPMVYLGLQYVTLDSARAKLTFTRGRLGRTCTIINYIYGVSQCLILGIFVIRPHKAGDRSVETLQEMHWYMRAHSACFLQFVPVLCLTMSSNYFEGFFSGIKKCKPSALGWVILIVYILATAMETVFATYAIMTYEGPYLKEGREKYFKVNPKLMQIIDYCWFLSLPLAASWQPPAPNLYFTYKLENLGDSDHNNIQYTAIRNQSNDSEDEDHIHSEKMGGMNDGDDTIPDQMFDKCIVLLLIVICHLAPIGCLLIWLCPDDWGPKNGEKVPIPVNNSVLLGIGLGVPIIALIILQWPVDSNLDPNPFPSSFMGFTLRDASFGISNFTMKLASFANAAKGSDFRVKYAEWFVSQTEDDPSVGVKFGGNTTMVYSWADCRDKLSSFADRIMDGTLERESELALAVQNNLMWPDAGKFALGFTNDDHATIRPIIAKMFDVGQGQPLGWTLESPQDQSTTSLRDQFRDLFENLPDGVLHCDLVTRNMWDVVAPSKSQTIVTQMVLKILHKVAFGEGGAISDAEAKDLAALQTTQLLPSACPARVARTYTIWSCIARPARFKARHYIQKYKDLFKTRAFLQRFPEMNGWSDKNFTLLASGFLDAMLQAGGRSVPLAIDLTMGYILSANRPECLNDVDFNDGANIRSLLMECMRYHPPVTVIPAWTREDPNSEDGPWTHDLICLDRGLADPEVFEDPDEFKFRDNNESCSMAWGDFALNNNDKADPHSHACPGKELSINLVVAFVQEYQSREWDLKTDDIKFNFYGTHGWTATKQE